MPYTYKSIGNTTAAVISLLAVGTLCWWQRTPGPINAPRPQDEAEIMTACLERHYAMKRTDTKFTITRPEYVSTIADSDAPGGFRYVTNSKAFTLTNTIGFFPNATFNYPQSIRDALAPCIGSYGRANACRWLLPSNTYWQTGERSFVWTEGMLANYLHTETNWWTNLVTLSTQTTLSTVYSNTIATNFAVLTTGWVATSTLVTDGNYCGRQTFSGHNVQWLPGTVFASNAVNPRFRIYDYADPAKFIPVYKFSSYWRALSGAAWAGESTDLALPAVMNPFEGSEGIITIDYGVFPAYTVTRSQALVTNTSPYNAWTSGKTFAFERDSKPYWWSTNAYNDMARALSMMQWQINDASIVCCTNVILEMYRTYEPDAPFTHTIYTNFEWATPYYGGYYPSTIHFAMRLRDVGDEFNHIYDWSGDPMRGGMKCWKYAITNNSCFAWTNVQILARVSTNNSYIAANATWTPDCYNYAITVTNYLPPGAGAVSSWYPFDPISAADFLTTNMVAWSYNALPWVPTVKNFGIPLPRLTVNENQGYDVVERCSEVAQGYLPYVNVTPATNVIAYRVQFTALTNYLDHAPAR